MKLFVLGANGATGTRIVDQAVAAGHEVTAMVRRDDAKTNPAAVKVIGDPLDAGQLERLAAGHDAILSALGVKSMGKTSLIERGVAALIQAATAGAPKRVVIESAFGVGDSAGHASAFAKLLYKTAMRNIYADKERAEQLLKASALDWTLVYPGMLSNKPLREYTATNLAELGKVSGMPSSTREGVADFMIKAAGATEWIKQTAVLKDTK